jgi:hypothetical protein
MYMNLTSMELVADVMATGDLQAIRQTYVNGLADPLFVNVTEAQQYPTYLGLRIISKNGV